MSGTVLARWRVGGVVQEMWNSLLLKRIDWDPREDEGWEQGWDWECVEGEAEAMNSHEDGGWRMTLICTFWNMS